MWDSVEGRIPLPPVAATLGLELIDADEKALPDGSGRKAEVGTGVGTA